MALPPSGTTEEAFQREVDEELRRAELVRIWRDYGRWIVGAVIAGLVLFAGYLFYQSHTEGTAGTQGERFDTAMRDALQGKTKSAVPQLDSIAKDGNPGYRAAARFAEADLLKASDPKAAAAKLGEIAGDTSLPQPDRDRATIEQTAVQMDTLKPEAVIDRLKSLANPDSVWFGSAGEMTAAAYLKLGKRDQAGKLYGQLAQSKGYVPDTIRQRAVQMAGVLGVDAINQSEEKKTQ